MTPQLEKAFGYRGDAMNLPVGDLGAALPFYQDVLGFRVVSRGETPHARAVLTRDEVQIGLAENGGDPEQDGCAFHVRNLPALLEEFRTRGLPNAPDDLISEVRDGSQWHVFFVVAPDGLCYWFGERQGSQTPISPDRTSSESACREYPTDTPARSGCEPLA
ncbi:MAG: VOC family protein [Vicinamibacterales bacterium]